MSLYDGIKADARVTPTLPTLRLPFDRNRVPKKCTHCGSGLLDLDEGRGNGPARLVCQICSQELAWLVTP